MAGQNWRKNKKGFMVNPEGKTARQVKQEKSAAKKAEAKASGGGGSGGGEASDPSRDFLVAEIGRLTKNVQAKVRQQKEALQEIEGTLKDAETKGRAKKVREEIQELGSLLNEVDKTIKQVDSPKPARKRSDEATQKTKKTKKPSDMSAREMQKEYDGIEKKQANLQDKLIDAGFGRVTISEMKRRRNENPLFEEYSELSDRKTELTLEARVRGSPGFQVRDLTSKHRNPYAKKPPTKRGE